MRKAIGLLGVLLVLSGCESTSKVLSYQPQVWKSEGYSLSVTRPGMATSTDTERVANGYCAQFQMVAKLTKLANPFIVPVRDEFICEPVKED